MVLFSFLQVFASYTTKSDARDYSDFLDEWQNIQRKNILIQISDRKNNTLYNHNKMIFHVLYIKSDITNESLKINSCYMQYEFSSQKILLLLIFHPKAGRVYFSALDICIHTNIWLCIYLYCKIHVAHTRNKCWDLFSSGFHSIFATVFNSQLLEGQFS